MLDEDNKQFAYAFLVDRENYHSQKENSAYTIFLVEAGLFGALWTTKALDHFKGTQNLCVLVTILLFFIWCLFHLLLRWQLRNRRSAALEVKTLLKAIKDHLANRPEPPQLQQKNPCCCCCLTTLLDYVVPCPKATILGEDKLQEFPDWYTVRYLAVSREDMEANFGEILPTYGSIIVLLATLVFVYIELR